MTITELFTIILAQIIRKEIYLKIGAEIFGELRNVVQEQNGLHKMSEKVTIEEVIESIGEKRTLLNNSLRT
jgi:hypothetical protein